LHLGHFARAKWRRGDKERTATEGACRPYRSRRQRQKIDLMLGAVGALSLAAIGPTRRSSVSRFIVPAPHPGFVMATIPIATFLSGLTAYFLDEISG
jgi:hypothetical protein